MFARSLADDDDVHGERKRVEERKRWRQGITHCVYAIIVIVGVVIVAVIFPTHVCDYTD